MPRKAIERVNKEDVKHKRAPGPKLFDWRKFDPSMIPDDGHYSFAEELTTYRDRLTELLEHEGEYVVIKGHEVIGFYPDRARALYEAAHRFKREPVLVKQVVAKEPISEFGRMDR